MNGVEIRAGITKYERSMNGRPVYGGIDDPRMGTSNPRERCKTCDCMYAGSESKTNDCPGHFGHIELCRPVYHVGFVESVTKILRCVCFHCSKLLVDKQDFRVKRACSIADPETRMREIHSLSMTKRTCEQFDSNGPEKPFGAMQMNGENGGENGAVWDGGYKEMDDGGFTGCGGALPRYNRKGSQIEIDFSGASDDFVLPGGKVKGKLSAAEAYKILKNIAPDDAKLLGLDARWCRPEWLLVSVLPVPPPPVRPSVEFNGATSADDLTHQLANIVKSNIFLENSIEKGEPADIQEQYEALLQQRVTAFFDNERADQPQETQRSGRALKTISQRLKGKEGRLRGNLMGKRVDFSARTVITADPNLSIDQVGVPRSVASRLTVPTMVTPFNIEQMRELVRRGPHEHPGAAYIIRADGRRIDLRHDKGKNSQILECGWTVERHLADDDIVLFNRQPSLHKMSIMGHRAKVLDWSTFRLNLSVTTPYNADFDGDEMNLHVPQSIVARADANELMMVPRNIVTPQSNRNVMGIVQDALLAVCNMTKRGVFLTKEDVMHVMMWMPSWNGVLPHPAILKPKQLWTGKQIFSLVTPNINYKGMSMCRPPKNAANTLNLYDCETLILNGELIQGTIDKAIVGAKAGSIVHLTWMDLGWEETRRFMNEVQMVVNAWMCKRSYTVGVADTVADKTTMNAIHAALSEAKTNVGVTMMKAQKGQLEGQAGKSISEKFEMTVNGLLNVTIGTAGKAALSSLKERNAIKGTVSAGSKGSSNNISQIIACVGQQNVQGARIKYGFQQRTMPHFSKDDLGMESRGFVENSYLRGLSPSEFYFHAMGGREGCIDTAVKTAETGYIQRRLVKAMETVMARYDGTMRNAAGCVMQFLYGQDGLDAQRIEKQTLDSYKLPMAKFRKKMYIDYLGLSGEADQLDYLTPEVRQDISENLNELHEAMEKEFNTLNADRALVRESLASRYSSSNDPMETDHSVHLPVNIDRLIWNAQRQFGCGDTRVESDLHPTSVQAAVKEICDECVIVKGDDVLSREAQYNATILWQALVRSKLATKRVLKDLRLNEMALNFLKGEITRCFHKTIVNPGEMCGVLAAQSLGEPATQMTLNTFHSTGISAKNVTLGVPRLNEILNIAKSPKTPSLTVYVGGGDAFDEEAVNEVMEQLEYTKLGDMMVKAEIHYDPDPETTVIEEDKEFVGLYFQIPDDEFNPENMSPWVLRIVLDRQAFDMRAKFLELDHIARKVQEYFPDGVHVINSDENCDDELVLRIRLILSEEDRLAAEEAGGSGDDEFLRRMMMELMNRLRLCGVHGIDKAYTAKRKQAVWTDETGFEEKTEYIIETNGSNLAEALACVPVDHTRTMSNDLVEMFQVLGIEGARSSLFHELSAILCFDNGYVNVRHITTLCDCMTFGGYLMAVSRHGINKSDVGPLLRASFEETVEIFMGAAMYSQYDYLDGVTQNVMLGQLAKVGTGTMDLLVDTEKLKEAIDYDHGMLMSAQAGGQVGVTDALTKMSPFQNSPTGYVGSESVYAGYTPDLGTPMTALTPAIHTPGAQSPLYALSPGAGASSPLYGAGAVGQSPAIYAQSPAYSPTSPMYSPQSPAFSPTSPSYSPTSPAIQYSPNSPAASPTSPAYSPTSPAFSPTSPAFSPSTPNAQDE